MPAARVGGLAAGGYGGKADREDAVGRSRGVIAVVVAVVGAVGGGEVGDEGVEGGAEVFGRRDDAFDDFVLCAGGGLGAGGGDAVVAGWGAGGERVGPIGGGGAFENTGVGRHKGEDEVDVM